MLICPRHSQWRNGLLVSRCEHSRGSTDGQSVAGHLDSTAAPSIGRPRLMRIQDLGYRRRGRLQNRKMGLGRPRAQRAVATKPRQPRPPCPPPYPRTPHRRNFRERVLAWCARVKNGTLPCLRLYDAAAVYQPPQDLPIVMYVYRLLNERRAAAVLTISMSLALSASARSRSRRVVH